MNGIINSKKDIYLDLALVINKLMLDDKLITYVLYKDVQDILLKNIHF